ncbi:AAA family ATPase [Sorangium sp. So ce119]|uniref:AAA family ATPase n=1 Tax=Sorangium sp. So ce119 TaxID=3133279 RepID=UPI003F5F0869
MSCSLRSCAAFRRRRASTRTTILDDRAFPRPSRTSLHVKNFTVFSEAELDFGAHLNVLVGENGTGKAWDISFGFSAQSTSDVTITTLPTEWVDATPVYLPTRELLTIYPGFVPVYENPSSRRSPAASWT